MESANVQSEVRCKRYTGACFVCFVRPSVCTTKTALCVYTCFKDPVVTICTTRFNIHKLLRSAHTVYLCVLCGSDNKQRLFYCTALTDWFL
jgi:hypothetical protein